MENLEKIKAQVTPWVANAKEYFESILPEHEKGAVRANELAIGKSLMPSSVEEFMQSRKNAKMGKFINFIGETLGANKDGNHPFTTNEIEMIGKNIDVSLRQNAAIAAQSMPLLNSELTSKGDSASRGNAVAQALNGSVLANQLQIFLPWFLTQPIRQISSPFFPTIAVGGINDQEVYLQGYKPGNMEWYDFDEWTNTTDDLEVVAVTSAQNIFQKTKGFKITYLEAAFLMEQNYKAKYPNATAPYNPSTGFGAELAARMRYYYQSNELLLDSVATVGSTKSSGLEPGSRLTNIVETTDIPDFATTGNFDTLDPIQAFNQLAPLANAIQRQSQGAMYGATLFVDYFTFLSFSENMGPAPSNVTLMNLLLNSGIFTAILPIMNWSLCYPDKATMIVANNVDQVWHNNVPLNMGAPEGFRPVIQKQYFAVPMMSRFGGMRIVQENGLVRAVWNLSSEAIAKRKTNLVKLSNEKKKGKK